MRGRLSLPGTRPRRRWRGRRHLPALLRRSRWAGFALLAAGLAVGMLDLAGYARTQLYGTADCRVTRVVDGDTVRLYCPGEGFASARLIGYDTPEIYSPRCAGELWAGVVAAWALQGRIWSAERVGIAVRGSDKYGRKLAVLTLDGHDVAAVMIEAGHGRAYDGGQRAGWCG